MLNLLQVKTAGKEAFQWGECSAPGSKLTAETDYSLFRSNNRKFMSVTLFFFSLDVQGWQPESTLGSRTA
jgi:hypothetical protein